MKHKKYFVFIITLIFCISFLNGTKASAYYDAASRLKSLGILDESGKEMSIITRGEFVKAIVNASGLSDDAHALIGPTIFSDIQPGSELSGYVNVAVNKNIMTGLSDGKFHPESNVSFAQACTILIRALGYTDKDLQGTWPKNYIAKAGEIGITSGVNLSNMAGLPNWAAVSMIDRLLDTNIKKSNPSDIDKTFAEAAGLTNESYQFAMIANPVYSKPQVVTDLEHNATRIGDIDLSGSQIIIKNGVPATINDIEDGDVIYQVTDVSGTKKYALVVDNKVQGKITAISASQVAIDGKTYAYGQGMDYYETLNSYGSLKIGDYVTILLGYDGKVVDFYNTVSEDNSNFAAVVNYSSDVDGYKVKLLMTDGNIREFKCDLYPGGYKGQLVKFTKLDAETVTLQSVAYSDLGEHTVNKDMRTIDDNYVSHNVKIFDIIDANTDNDQDANVKIVNWSDMTSGDIQAGKIMFMNRTGKYNDINVILTNDVLEDKDHVGIVNGATAIVKQMPTGQVDQNGKQITQSNVLGFTYNIIVDGVEKTWDDYDINNYYNIGTVLDVEISNNNIEQINKVRTYETNGTKFDAIDVDRIMINGKAYFLKGKPEVYVRTTDGNYVSKDLSYLEVGKNYKLIKIYLDKPLQDGGKVDVIVVE